jgi:hypothetical protein
MVYRFDFVPAGIMSWFIVRTHRYTTNRHWRDGVLLEYEGHDARVELNPLVRELRLLVTGVSPHNFFTILKNTLDLLLARFEGLRVSREVPCICHWQRQGEPPCGRFYPYDDLVRRMERGRYMVECPETFEQVSVRTLLFGIHESTLDEVMVRIDENTGRIDERTQRIEQGQVQTAEDIKIILQQNKQMLQQNEQMSELLNREFTRQWNLEMQKLEAECPSTFFLMPGDERRFNPKNWVSQEYRLHLVCQHPPQPHGVSPSYSLRQPAEWWATVSPWLNQAIRFLKYAVPMGKAIGAVYDEEAMEALNTHAELMEKMVSSLPKLPGLRALCTYLEQVDKPKHWGGLERTLTPDGNILWLCHEHRQPYEVRALVLD